MSERKTQQRALVGNAGDSEQVKRAARRAETKRERELNDIRAVMGTPEGRRFVWRLMGKAQVFETCFDMNPQMMSWQEGRRDVGLFVMAETMEADPTLYLQMQGEAIKLERSEAPPPVSADNPETNE